MTLCTVSGNVYWLFEGLMTPKNELERRFFFILHLVDLVQYIKILKSPMSEMRKSPAALRFERKDEKYDVLYSDKVDFQVRSKKY